MTRSLQTLSEDFTPCPSGYAVCTKASANSKVNASPELVTPFVTHSLYKPAIQQDELS